MPGLGPLPRVVQEPGMSMTLMAGAYHEWCTTAWDMRPDQHHGWCGARSEFMKCIQGGKKMLGAGSSTTSSTETWPVHDPHGESIPRMVCSVDCMRKKRGT